MSNLPTVDDGGARAEAHAPGTRVSVLRVMRGDTQQSVLDLFDAEAIANAHGAGRGTPSVCDIHEADRVLRRLRASGAHLQCGCLGSLARPPELVIEFEGCFRLRTRGSGHALDCVFRRASASAPCEQPATPHLVDLATEVGLVGAPPTFAALL